MGLTSSMTPSQHGLLQGLRHGAPAEGPLSGRVQAQVQPSICSTPKHSHGGGAPCGQMFGRAPRLSAMAPGSSASHVIDHAELSGPSSRASVALEMRVPNQGCPGDTSRRVPLLPNRPWRSLSKVQRCQQPGEHIGSWLGMIVGVLDGPQGSQFRRSTHRACMLFHADLVLRAWGPLASSK